MDNENIPIIDVSPFFAGGAGGRRVVEQVDAACKDHGFLILTGHGVPTDTIDGMYRTSRAFFDLPRERKLECSPPAPDIFRGYIGMAVTGLSYSMNKPTPPDLREVYISGTVEEMPADYVRALDAGNRLPPNIWPEGLPGFRAAWEAYQRAMAALSRRLLAIFGAALDLPRGFFDAKIDKSNSFILTANYPALREPPLPGQLRAGAHTDFGVLTVIYQDDAPGGLEVQARDGRWLGVRPVAGSLVVNLGDIMAQWTNDRWVSSMHRVVPPPPALAASSRRQSMSYFFHPNYDAVIECIPSCAGPACASKYPPTIAHEFMFGKTSKSVHLETS